MGSIIPYIKQPTRVLNTAHLNYHGYRLMKISAKPFPGIPCHSLDRLDDHTFTTSLGKTVVRKSFTTVRGLDETLWGSSSVGNWILLEKMRILWILCSTWKSQNWMLTHVCIVSKGDGFPAPLCISFHTNCLYYQNLWMHTPKSSFVYPLQVKNKKHFLWCRVVPSYFSVAFLSLQSSLHSHLAALCLPVESVAVAEMVTAWSLGFAAPWSSYLVKLHWKTLELKVLFSRNPG